jgi:hypothetical protein
MPRGAACLAAFPRWPESFTSPFSPTGFTFPLKIFSRIAGKIFPPD